MKTESRKNVYNRKALLTALLVFAITVIAFISGNVIVKANNPSNNDIYQKSFHTITVHEGDSLWSIARDNMNTAVDGTIYQFMNEIMKLNHMTSDQVHIGQKLLISSQELHE